jgi:hypothetical protein
MKGQVPTPLATGDIAGWERRGTDAVAARGRRSSFRVGVFFSREDGFGQHSLQFQPVGHATSFGTNKKATC